uniref:Uncharacterized protein n=1 Tax=Candidatus Kentrum sp. FM TaxID=2126340 RepID=A0A450W1M5_9GAMM|nr:MAG: hypothetical protein BECKFM1743C_GA0114222_101536 [Candidatus Kentron sp. FM]VFJ55767.1 MAG: hypothetical protein BECKFM1743A_GA0114220_101553 [Candidatus Kentron sp. FM]VFK10964.1 MAG: hypothetical protein BECKFM1743B_GA0114221_101623 [Candidatus Kentron sp. FM]
MGSDLLWSRGQGPKATYKDPHKDFAGQGFRPPSIRYAPRRHRMHGHPSAEKWPRFPTFSLRFPKSDRLLGVSEVLVTGNKIAHVGCGARNEPHRSAPSLMLLTAPYVDFPPATETWHLMPIHATRQNHAELRITNVFATTDSRKTGEKLSAG